MMSEQKLVCHMQLSVFPHVQVKVVNLESFSGIDGDVLAFGFDENGNPVTRRGLPVKYKTVGNARSNVNLNTVFNHGLNTDCGRDRDGKIVLGQKLTEWEAITLMLSRNGLYASPTRIKTKAEELIKNGLKQIHFVKLNSLCGMDGNYGNIENDWMLLGTVPPVDYDLEFNPLLKRLKSPWRIQTPKTLKALHALTLRNLINQ